MAATATAATVRRPVVTLAALDVGLGVGALVDVPVALPVDDDTDEGLVVAAPGTDVVLSLPGATVVVLADAEDDALKKSVYCWNVYAAMSAVVVTLGVIVRAHGGWIDASAFCTKV
ncbi:hypothetical protein SPRG_19643 [Saprolegnia parasitica CBS 223.65]|uniref:Uncharacterized protein n=1 Tax=Saprolegnia parasitica (strain CBS 223.65) TaxID=695850 RepID=A0A067CI44_SAPPC|nr:hypothetical protein SPRG_19643 [Saprolegnia parasitica CBS 223.65]KDO30419.1 hypothetical protein SPRG_19643 [Saprolegnia parasitica CBS 223.65]|eukprot:XP_012198873.1 hypothetical protein SPRG_19643 [Saprolegnia parasitica CBS 223.65]